jgi:hypothetical protein
MKFLISIVASFGTVYESHAVLAIRAHRNFFWGHVYIRVYFQSKITMANILGAQ